MFPGLRDYYSTSDRLLTASIGRTVVTFDGSHAEGQIEAELPTDFRRLLTAKFVRELHHPTGALLHVLTVNSTCSDWTPRVPVRLYAASGDDTVTQANADQCAASPARFGARCADERRLVGLTDGGKVPAVVGDCQHLLGYLRVTGVGLARAIEERDLTDGSGHPRILRRGGQRVAPAQRGSERHVRSALMPGSERANAIDRSGSSSLSSKPR
jgi:hypothetical protein